MQQISDEQLKFFVDESNRIECITLVGEEKIKCFNSHVYFLGLETIAVDDVELFVAEVADAALRLYKGMDVRIGRHFPIAGGPAIGTMMQDIINDINHNYLSPLNMHRRYERLHPFMDGNGRSGRLLWLWHNLSINEYMGLGFLHQWYYNSLE